MGVDASTPAKIAPANIGSRLAHSWLLRVDLRLIAERVGTPVFIYSEEQLVRNIGRIKDAATAAGLDARVELYIPFFPNSNPHVLRPLRSTGVGILLQLPSEYKILQRFGFDKFIVSPGHVSDRDIGFWCATNHPLFLSSLDEISYFLRINAHGSVNVRLDSLGSGKPGIKYNQLKELSDLLAQHGRDLDCFELYCGSGNSVYDMVGILEQVFMIFRTYFPKARAINFAGGYGFAYEEWNEPEKHFEWGRYFLELRDAAARHGVPDNVKFLFEPARDVLGDVGALLLSVKRNVIANLGSNQVLTDGSRVLIPSAQYKERRHNVIFLDSSLAEIRTENPIRATLRGRGILRHDYILPGEYWVPDNVDCEDYMVILDVGAYCATQHMEFLNIPPAAEVVVDTSGEPQLVTAPGDELDKWRHLLAERMELRSAVAKPVRKAM